MASIGIYKIISPSHRIYIGQSINIERRWTSHKNAKTDYPLSRAFKKYGVDNFSLGLIPKLYLGI